MKALVYTGPDCIELRNLPAPEADGEVLVDVAFCGICGSDMHAFRGHDDRRPAPLVLGHEAAGTIRGGGRVVLNPLVTCMACSACQQGRTNLCAARQILSMPPRAGAFAQVIRAPQRNLLPVPDRLPLSKAALTEPLACGWHAARLALATNVPFGPEPPLVLGGGAIGIACALALVAHGADTVTVVEPNAARRPQIAAAGPFHVAAPEEAADFSTPLVVDAYGGGTTRAAASALVRPGGTIVHVGLADAAPGFDTRRATLHEITFVGAYTYTAAEFGQTLDAIANGRLGDLNFAEERKLEDGPRAFQDLSAGQVAAPKILLAL